MAAVRTAAVAEVIAFGIEARRVVDFALGSLSRRTFHGLAFHRRAFTWIPIATAHVLRLLSSSQPARFCLIQRKKS